MTYSTEQYRHDEINLKRLVRRLEKSASDQEWQETDEDVWIKAQGTLQKIKHARKLLKNVDLYDEDPTPQKAQQYDEIRKGLDRVEAFTKEVEERTRPKPVRPEPLLPHIPIPPLPVEEPEVKPSRDDSAPSEEAPMSLPANDLLLPSDTPAYPSSSSFSFPTPTTLIPSNLPHSSNATASATGAAPRFLQNSTALQQELSDQLAQMATQLKRNAQHFSNSLAKDQAVVEDTQQKLEGNFDIMQKERIRLRDHRGKSTSTTCLVVLISVTVVLLFMLMVSIIRFT